MPKNIKKCLREKEFNSNVHVKHSERNVYYDKNIWAKYYGLKKILIVDDSIDTGYSAKFVKEAVERFFQNSESVVIKVAALNVFNKSKKVFKTDYYIYEDTMLKGPWSSDSKENNKYLDLYNEWHIQQE